MARLIILLIISLFSIVGSFGQTGSLSGTISWEEGGLPFASVGLLGSSLGSATNDQGYYLIKNVPVGKYTLVVSSIGFDTQQRTIAISANENLSINIKMIERAGALDAVVVSASMKEVSKLESPVPVEVYSQTFFKANPTPSVFESLQNVNGVRPQLNCNVCNTGDIHINGLDALHHGAHRRHADREWTIYGVWPHWHPSIFN